MDLTSLLLAQATEPQGFLGLVDKLARTPLSQVVIFVAACSVVRIALFPYLTKTAPHLRYGAYPFARYFNEFLDAVIYAGVFVFLIIRPFAIQTFYIPSGSMVDTLLVRDYIIANKFVYRFSEPQHGDIVVFKPPKRALFPGQSETDFIKRVIGIPGDTIEVRGNVLYRNGKAVEEQYKRFTKPDSMWHDTEHFVVTTQDDAFPAPVYDFKLVQYRGEYWPLCIQNDMVNAEGMPIAKEFQVNDYQLMSQLRELPPAKIPPGHLLMMGDNRNGSFDSRGWGLVERDKVIGRSEVIWLPVSRWRVTR